MKTLTRMRLINKRTTDEERPFATRNYYSDIQLNRTVVSQFTHCRLHKPHLEYSETKQYPYTETLSQSRINLTCCFALPVKTVRHALIHFTPGCIARVHLVAATGGRKDRSGINRCRCLPDYIIDTSMHSVLASVEQQRHYQRQECALASSDRHALTSVLLTITSPSNQENNGIRLCHRSGDAPGESL